jgi:hypothetical protein
MIPIMEYDPPGEQVAAARRQIMQVRLIVAAVLAAAGAASAQDHVHSASGAALTESGHAGFAAIQEAVAALSADPSTDWSRANIERLRQHLTDMDEVTLRAAIQSEDIPAGARFIVSGEGRTREAIRNMVVGHVRAVGEDEHWTLTVQETEHGAIVTARGRRPADTARIRGLGLIGVIASGAHHQPHHLMLARGGDPHQ